MIFKINTPINEVHFKSIKGKKVKIFYIDTSYVYTRSISHEHKQTSNGDSKWEMITSFLHSFLIGTPRTNF